MLPYKKYRVTGTTGPICISIAVTVSLAHCTGKALVKRQSVTAVGRMVFIKNEVVFVDVVKNLLWDLHVDADLRELSEYVLTIIKGDKTSTELHDYCREELKFFLKGDTEVFVHKLMKSLDNDSYLDSNIGNDETEIINTTTSETNDTSDIDDSDNRKQDDMYADLEYSDDINNKAHDDTKETDVNYRHDTFNDYRGEYRGGRGGRWSDRGGRGRVNSRWSDRGSGRGGRGSYDARVMGYNGDQRHYNSNRYHNQESLPIHASNTNTINPYDVMSFYTNNNNDNTNNNNRSSNSNNSGSNTNDDNSHVYHDNSHTGSELDSYSNNHYHGTRTERPYIKRNYNSTADNAGYNEQSRFSFKKAKTSVAALSYSRDTGGGHKVDHTEIVLKKKLEEEGRIKNQYDEMKQLREQALEIREKKMALMKKYKAIISKLPTTELSEEKQKLKETLTEKIAKLDKELSVE